MKRCPQCQSVFENSLVYCTNDGTMLVEENFALPSEAENEEITVIRHEPLNIEIPHAPDAAEFVVEPSPATIVPGAPIVIERERRGTGKYFLFLVIGLLLGGGLVLATLLFARYLNEDRPVAVNVNADRPATTEPVAKAKETPAETAPTPDARHARPTDADDEDFNGRVITLGANVRSGPDRGASEVGVLPINDRLTIEYRENENSPWYYVTCEHGTSGWMHGNTIEYAR